MLKRAADPGSSRTMQDAIACSVNVKTKLNVVIQNRKSKRFAISIVSIVSHRQSSMTLFYTGRNASYRRIEVCNRFGDATTAKRKKLLKAKLNNEKQLR
jgi:hypothetical protein